MIRLIEFWVLAFTAKRVYVATLYVPFAVYNIQPRSVVIQQRSITNISPPIIIYSISDLPAY